MSYMEKEKYVIIFIDENNNVRKYELDNTQFGVHVQDNYVSIVQVTNDYIIETYIPMHRILRITVTTEREKEQ